MPPAYLSCSRVKYQSTNINLQPFGWRVNKPMPALRQCREIRATNYLSVNVMDRIDQPWFHSVQAWSSGELHCSRRDTEPEGRFTAALLLGDAVAGLCALHDHSCCQAGQSRRLRPEHSGSVESREEKRAAGNPFCWWEGRLLSCECSGAAKMPR